MTDLNDIKFNETEGINTPSEEETLNSEPEIIKEPNPWDNAPTGVWFYDIQYEDGRLGNMTQSAERAYKRGWDLSNNIPVEDVQVSDINHGYYPKELCPHKTQEMLLTEARNNKLSELKKKSLEALETAYVDSSLGFRVDANTTAVRDLEGLVIIADSSVMFCDFNNEFHALTKEQIQTLQREVLLNGQNLYAQKWTFRNRIESAESIEDLNDIQISFEMLDFSSL